MLLSLSPRAGAVLALVAANVVWGTTFVATKPLLERVPPLTVAAARFAVAVAILWPLVRLAGRRPVLGRLPALMGFVGVFLVYLCQNVGLQYTSATNGALIHGGIPVLTALLAAPFLGERPGVRGAAGISISLVGVAAVVALGPGAELGLSALGDALVLASALALAAYFVAGRRAFAGRDPVALAAGVAGYGLLYLLPASAAELAVDGMARPTAGDLLGLLYLGAGASALAFVLWGHGLRHLAAGQAAAFANLTPLVGVAVAALLLGEAVSTAQLAGGLLILGGVWLAARRPTPAAVPAAPRLGPPAGSRDARASRVSPVRVERGRRHQIPLAPGSSPPAGLPWPRTYRSMRPAGPSPRPRHRAWPTSARPAGSVPRGTTAIGRSPALPSRPSSAVAEADKANHRRKGVLGYQATPASSERRSPAVRALLPLTTCSE